MYPHAPVYIAKLLLRVLFMDPMTFTPNGAGNRSLASALYVLYFWPLPCCQALKIARAILITYQRRLSVCVFMSRCLRVSLTLAPGALMFQSESTYNTPKESTYFCICIAGWLLLYVRRTHFFRVHHYLKAHNTLPRVDSLVPPRWSRSARRGKGGIFWALALTIDVKFLARIQYEYGEFAKTFCKALLDDK